MAQKWKTNGWVTVVNIFTILLIFIQISNSQYHCFSNDLQNCKGLLSVREAQCTGPGTFIGQLSQIETPNEIVIYCPWDLWQTIKVLVLSFVILLIINWYTLRLILSLKGFVLPFVICLGITSPLMMASGIVDLVMVATSECTSSTIRSMEINEDCERTWFYINAVMEMLAGILIGITCFFMLRWRKSEKLRTQEGNEDGYFNAEKSLYF